jgi:hypothetical protein
MDNQTIVEMLTGYARRLETEQANLYRIKAYRRAAQTIESLAMPVTELVAQQGVHGLEKLPGIGGRLAFAIERLAATGDFHALTDDTEPAPPEEQVESLTGIGPHLAQLLWEKLGVRTVGDLLQAIETKRLDTVPLGNRRRQHVVQAARQWQQRRQAPKAPAGEPEVAELLRVDAQYREEAEEGQLPSIAPHGQNPDRLRWLPLLSLRRDGWKYRALFSNTALTHRLGRTHDWVVIYFENEHAKGQRTVVTEHRGDLRGQRVVRGREEECRLRYGGLTCVP